MALELHLFGAGGHNYICIVALELEARFVNG